MVPEHAMSWIAGWFPLLSFIVGFIVYYWLRRAWIATVVVLVVTLGAMFAIFSMHFWSWLLLYLFLCWFACWAAHMVRNRPWRQG